MGKSSSQVVGYRYYAKFAVFIGNRIEKLLSINFDKRGWIKKKTWFPYYTIDKPDLYGENEGGVAGVIYERTGLPDGEVDPIYQAYQPLASGYPYQSYLIFSGLKGIMPVEESPELQEEIRPYHNSGFYLGNSGYMKEMLLWVKRIYVKNNGDAQWYFEKAGIGANLIPYELTLIPYVTSDVEISANQELLGTTGLNGVRDHTIHYSANLDPVIDSDSFRSIFTTGGDDSVIQTATFKTKYDFTAITGLFIGRVRSLARCKNHELSITSNRFIEILNRSSGVITLQNASNEYEDYNYIELEFVCDGGSYITVETTASGSVDRGGFFGGEILRLESGSFLLKKFTVKYKGSPDAIDINPVHKIREILTDDTAMGKPESDVNYVNFMKAADRIYDEGLGISWAIDEKSCIEAIEELCYHIEAGIRVNRQTGLYEMVLFRDDWFEADEIHDIAENKIKDLSLEVMNSDDIVNQLNVTYYDRQRIKNSTFSIYENGSILTMGHANAESVDFPYFMFMRNAEIVANWKLKQFSTPAWSGSFTTGWREARKWNRYDLIRLPWSSKWNGTILVRIMKINLGNDTNNTVTIDFEEVIPYSGDMNTSIVVDESMHEGVQTPQPSENAVFEAPYYLTVLKSGQTSVDAELSNNPDIGYVAAIAAKPQNNSLNALLYTDGGVGEFEQVSRLDYCDILQLEQSIVETTASFTVTGSLTQAANSNNVILLNDEFMGFVSFDDVTKVLTVKRGVLDTVPKKHSSGSLFVFDLPDVAFDSTQYTKSEIVRAQVSTTTPSGIQESGVRVVPVEIQSRAIRPYPPANVKINGEYWPENISGDAAITWVDRNRLQQTGGNILGWFDGGVTAEAGLSYRIELWNGETLEKSIDNVVTGDTIPIIDFYPERLMRIYSVRDGYDSYSSVDILLSSSIGSVANVFRETYAKNEIISFNVLLTSGNVNSVSIVNGSLPSGWALSGSVISGSATTDGQYSFDIEVIDEFGNTIGKSFVVKVAGLMWLQSQFDISADKIGGTWSLGSGNSLVSDVTRKNGLKTLRLGNGVNKATAVATFSKVVPQSIMNSDFTITSWIKRTALANASYVFKVGSVSSNTNRNSFALTGSQAQWFRNSNGVNMNLVGSYSGPVDLQNDWIHVAEVRKNDVAYLFVAGKLVAQQALSNPITQDQAFLLGGLRASSIMTYTDQLWIDEIKIYQGIGLWTDDYDQMVEW